MVIICALSLLISGFLIFLIQPLTGKILLPFVGGSSQTWNVSMFSYQLFLLLGYLYAHFLHKKFSIIKQAKIHFAILAFSTLSPLAFNLYGVETASQNPQIWLIRTLVQNIGLLFMLLAANTLIIQNIVANSNLKISKNPYILYSASNLGSFLALISYPLIIEPLFTISQTMKIWSSLYYLFFIFFILIIFYFYESQSKNLNQGKSVTICKPIDWKQKLNWIKLSFLPSALMLSLTHYITSELSAIPFIWIVTLSIYLFTFILAFANFNRTYRICTKLQIITSFTVIMLVIVVKTQYIGLLQLTPLHLLTLFCISMMCHSQLAKQAPDNSNLTQFYIWIALGGMLGGLFCTFLVPILFNDNSDYLILIIASCLLRESKLAKKMKFSSINMDFTKPYIKNLVKIATLMISVKIFLYAEQSFLDNLSSDHKATIIAVTSLIFIAVYGYCYYKFQTSRIYQFIFLLATLFIFTTLPQNRNEITLYQKRNFFGTLKVIENKKANLRGLYNGKTAHGFELIDKTSNLENYKGYYHAIYDFFEKNNNINIKNIGIIGLGIGELANLNNDKNYNIDFFEINPEVVAISRNTKYFSTLSRHSKNVKVHVGDGRILIGKQNDRKYDVIIIDAYNSDSIPTHLMTFEAFMTYHKKLSDNGIILLHISNTFFEFSNVVNTIVASMRYYYPELRTLHKQYSWKVSNNLGSQWMIIYSHQDEFQAKLLKDGWRPPEKIFKKSWSDNYVNVLQVF